MIAVSCYNCASITYTNYLAENGFNLVKCKRCGLLYVNPRLDDSEINEATKIGTHKGIKDLMVTGSYDVTR